METYNVDYFIKKFQAIDDDKWLIGSIGKDGKHCAAGHCGLRAINGYIETIESMALLSLFTHITDHNLYRPVLDINDGINPYYNHHSSPKQRILAALYDIKAKQKPEIKERIVYITVDAPVRELQKAELSLS